MEKRTTMKKRQTLVIMFSCVTSILLASTNALIEVKLFKDWVIEGERSFGSIAIENTGTTSFLLAKDSVAFESGQMDTRSYDTKQGGYTESMRNHLYEAISLEGDDSEFFSLSPGETHVYEGRKFLLSQRSSFSEEMRFIVSVYLGKSFWLDSEPLIVKGIVPSSFEQLAMIKDKTRNNHEPARELAAVTYKNERWLYYSNFYPVCPLSLMGKVRVEPHDGKGLFKIWDGNKSMIFNMYRGGIIVDGSDEHNVLDKWTRERKQKAEASNAEVRRKRAETENGKVRRDNARTETP